MHKGNLNRKAFLKKTALITGALILLFLLVLSSIFVVKPPFLNYWIENNINKKLQKASSGLYHFGYSAIKIDMTGPSIHVTDFTIYTDSLSTADSVLIQNKTQGEHPRAAIINFKATEVNAKGISLLSLLLFNKLKLDSLNISQPVIHLNLTGDGKHETAQNPEMALQDGIRKQTLELLKTVSIGKINISKGNMIVVDRRAKSELQAGLYNFNISLHDILLNKKNIAAPETIMGAGQLQLSAEKLELPSRNELYTFTMDSVQIDSKDSSLSVRRVQYIPLYSKKEFHQKTGIAIDRMDFNFSDIKSAGADIPALINKQELRVRHLYINGGVMDFFKNKLYPKPERNFTGKYPHQLLLRSNLPIRIDSISLRQFQVHYGELSHNTGKAGVIRFENTHGTITNLTNDSLRIAEDPLCKVDVISSFMNEGTLNAYFRFPLNTPNGSFSCGGKMNNFDMPHMNEVVSALTYVGIQSGKANRLDFNMNATDHAATITMDLEYDNLKIDLYKPLKGSNELKKRTFLMKLINGIVIQQDNPRNNNPVRQGKATAQRDSDQSFFNFIWTTIQQPVIRIVTGKDDRDEH